MHLLEEERRMIVVFNLILGFLGLRLTVSCTILVDALLDLGLSKLLFELFDLSVLACYSVFTALFFLLGLLNFNPCAPSLTACLEEHTPISFRSCYK